MDEINRNEAASAKCPSFTAQVKRPSCQTSFCLIRCVYLQPACHKNVWRQSWRDAYIKWTKDDEDGAAVQEETSEDVVKEDLQRAGVTEADAGMRWDGGRWSDDTWKEEPKEGDVIKKPNTEVIWGKLSRAPRFSDVMFSDARQLFQDTSK